MYFSLSIIRRIARREIIFHKIARKLGDGTKKEGVQEIKVFNPVRKFHNFLLQEGVVEDLDESMSKTRYVNLQPVQFRLPSYLRRDHNIQQRGGLRWRYENLNQVGPYEDRGLLIRKHPNSDNT